MLELHDPSPNLTFSLLGQPELRPPKGASGCNPTVGAVAGVSAKLHFTERLEGAVLSDI